MAILIPCLKTLFSEFDTIAPGRDKGTDGWIGDTSHSASSSDHNPDETGNTPERDSDNVDEVHAIDVDKDLRENYTMEDCVQYLLSECRKSGTSGKDRGRLKYIIYNRRIWEGPNWSQQSYSGSNPHDKHAHFSAEYSSAQEADTNTWGLISKFGDVVDSAQEDRIAEKTMNKVWGRMFNRPDGPDHNGNTQTSAGAYQSYTDVMTNDAADRVIDNVDEVDKHVDTVGNQVESLSGQVTVLSDQVKELTDLITSFVSGVNVRENHRKRRHRYEGPFEDPMNSEG